MDQGWGQVGRRGGEAGGGLQVSQEREPGPSSEVSPSVSQKSSGKYPKVQELLQGRRARCYLLPAPGQRRASKGHGSPGGECPREQGLPSLPSSRPRRGPSELPPASDTLSPPKARSCSAPGLLSMRNLFLRHR